MANHIIDMTARRFGKLTVLEPAGRSPYNQEVIWQCRCDCGKLTKYHGSELRFGKVKSCGCNRRKNNG